ncbi:hypothetical protein [Pseudaestuariivita sp.]|uniref:hypothetical protein n=1 Tax=Pseudaestuariivita sp. TaxID=2211669 RepID=UPI004058591A
MRKALLYVLLTGLFALGVVATTAQATEAEIDFRLPKATSTEGHDISIVVDRGLRKTKYLRSRELRQARVALLDKQELPRETLKALADRQDTLAALRYSNLLWREGLEENATEIAQYASISAGAGRVSSLKKMIRAMEYLDPDTTSQALKNQLMRILYPYAWAGNPLAMDAVVAYNGEGRLFGKLSARTRARIEEHSAGGDGRVELRMALDLIRNTPRTPEAEAQARRYLERAQSSSNLAVRTMALNMSVLLADPASSGVADIQTN